jgi:hypothetical protein
VLFRSYLTNSLEDVLQTTGPIEVDGSGVLKPASYLSEAAQIAFDIGVRQIIVCQVSANTPAAFATAYGQLEVPVNSVNPYYIVPLLGSLSTSGDFVTARGTAITHVNKMASEEFGKERRLYVGMKDYVGSGLGVDDFTALASAIANSRVTLSGNYNPVRIISIGAGTYSNVLDGCFDAVKLAAYRSTQFASDPMMNRAITGAFTGFDTRWNDPEIDALVDGGVCVSEELSGIIKVVDDITTDISDEVEVDIATVEARDVLISGMRNAIDARFKGMRGDNTVSAQLKDFSNIYLQQRAGDGLIAGIGAVSASRQTGSLRKWQISFSYLPVTKVRDVKVTFSVDLGLAA